MGHMSQLPRSRRLTLVDILLMRMKQRITFVILMKMRATMMMETITGAEDG